MSDFMGISTSNNIMYNSNKHCGFLYAALNGLYVCNSFWYIYNRFCFGLQELFLFLAVHLHCRLKYLKPVVNSQNILQSAVITSCHAEVCKLQCFVVVCVCIYLLCLLAGNAILKVSDVLNHCCTQWNMLKGISYVYWYYQQSLSLCWFMA